jgi:hypothetical protein
LFFGSNTHIPDGLGFLWVRADAGRTDDVPHETKFVNEKFTFLWVAFHAVIFQDLQYCVQVGEVVFKG